MALRPVYARDLDINSACFKSDACDVCESIEVVRKSISRLFYDMAAWGRLMKACQKPHISQAVTGGYTYTWPWAEGPYDKEWIEYIP